MKTVYITEQGTVLARKGERLLIKMENTVLHSLHIRMIDRIFIFGRCMLTPAAIDLTLKNNVPVIFFSIHGKLKGVLEPTHAPDIYLRFRQFLLTGNPEYSLSLAKKFVKAKIRNQRRVLQRLKRYRDLNIDAEISKLKILQNIVNKVRGFSSLRGIEGKASHFYFSAFKKCVPESFSFKDRTRRPPKDPVNSLLSFGYSLLTSEIFGFLKAHGFDPYLGFFHRMRYNRPALALDLIEEFRHAIVDLFVIDLLSHGKLSQDDFFATPESAWFLKKRGRAAFFRSYEQRMKVRMTASDNQKYTLRQIVEFQILNLKRKILNGDDYKPFLLP